MVLEPKPSELVQEFNSKWKDENQRTQLADAVHHVHQLGGCVRCSIRYLCLPIIQLFNLNEMKLVDFYNDFISKKDKLSYPTTESPTCRICLGILQDNYEEKDFFFKKQILDDIKNCGYDYNDFQFCLTLPHAILVRELALLKQLRENYK